MKKCQTRDCARMWRASVVFAAAFLTASPAIAQTAPSASRVAPESLAPLKADETGAIALPEHATADAPPGADRLNVTLRQVLVEGGRPEFAAISRQVTAELTGHSVKVSEIYAAAGRIEAAYARAGFVLTRVTLPPQRIVDGGDVRFLIVDGYIEDVDASGVPARVRTAVRKRVGSLVGAKGLTLAQIERRVLLAGDVPGVQLRTTLIRGSAVGATRLILEAKYRPVSASLSLENDLGYAYENQALSAQVALNSVLGLGEQLYAQATTGPDIGTLFNGAPRRRVLGLGAIFALGDNGLTFNPEYTVVDTNPRVPQGGVQVTGHFERLSFRAAYPLIRTRRERLGLSASFDLLAETEEAKAFGLTLNHDRLRMANIGLNWSRSLAASTVIATDAQFTQGIAGLGARKLSDVIATNVPFTRQGAKPDFSKLGGHWRSDTQLGEGFSLTTIARGQASLSGVLPAPAQFSLDGSDALSSFSQGSVNADSGVTGRAELARAMPYGRQNRSLITPYAFGAVGYGHVSNPTVLEAENINTWAFGGGLRMLVAAYDTGLTGFSMVEVSHGHSTTLPQNPTRVSFSFTVRY
jgi:hemolysin activation/secretion protein